MYRALAEVRVTVMLLLAQLGVGVAVGVRVAVGAAVGGAADALELTHHVRKASRRRMSRLRDCHRVSRALRYRCQERG